jgi:hypothetical protein
MTVDNLSTFYPHCLLYIHSAVSSRYISLLNLVYVDNPPHFIHNGCG